MKLPLIILAVEDVGRAARFYETVIGGTRRVDVPVYVELEFDGGWRLGVYQREGFARSIGGNRPLPSRGQVTATELYLHCEDLPAACERLEQAGARVLSPAAMRPWGDEVAYFADLDGNVVAVWSASHQASK